MKLQYLAVIFIIIIVPITMVMSQYIQTQIDTIKLQSLYKTNLDGATHDALMAFQLNTTNNKYSSISDSKIRDVEASVNTFYNSLGTSMKTYIASRETLSSFIPAILFTLYDGYYIYSSYDNVYATTGENENKRIQIEGNRNYQDGLRPYIYYSCKYKLSNGKIVVVNYTLDNAITIYGDVGDGKGYQTKSGYLINPKKIDLNSIQDDLTGHGDKKLIYDGVEIEPETLTEHLLIVEEDDKKREIIVAGDYNYIVYNNKKVYQDVGKDGKPNGEYFWYDNYKKTYLQSEKANVQRYIDNNGVGFKSISAFEYYYEAYQFSNWLVGTNLKNVTQKDAMKMSEGDTVIGNDTEYLSVNTENDRIFDITDDDNDPLVSGSTFNTHRVAIIRKSIETNLTTAIANYTTQNYLSTYDFTLPVIDEENWYNIANNVSIVSFMQGIPIGMKYFNNYSVVTNTKNEEVVNAQSLYIVTQEVRNDGIIGEIEYHQPGCKTLIDDVNSGKIKITGAYTSLSFQRQTVKVTEANIHYFYPQARMGTTTTGCYNCIVNAAVDYDIDDVIKGEIKNYLTEAILYNANDLQKVRKTYLTALARERYDLYKSNF